MISFMIVYVAWRKLGLLETSHETKVNGIKLQKATNSLIIAIMYQEV